jgi:hypothetical protein
MNKRERNLLIATVAVGVLFGGWFLVNQFYLAPLQQRDKRLAALKAEVAKKDKEVAEKRAARKRLEKLRDLSLPADMTDKPANPNALARSEYEKYLRDLLDKSGFPASRTITAVASHAQDVGKPGSKETLLVPLTFVVEAKYEPARADGKASHGVELPALVKMLDGFYKTPLLHRIQNISIKTVTRAEETTEEGSKGPPGAPQLKFGEEPVQFGGNPPGQFGGGKGGFPGGKGGFGGNMGGFGGKGKGKGRNKDTSKELDVRMTIEAVVVQGAQKRPFLFPLDRRQVAVDLVTAVHRIPMGLVLMQFSMPPSPPSPDSSGKSLVSNLTNPKANIFQGIVAERKKDSGPKQDVWIEDVRELVKLMLVQRTTKIGRDGKPFEEVEAFLRNHLTNQEMRLRTSKGFDTFVIYDDDGDYPKLKGKVVRIDVDNRLVVFQDRDDGYYYLIETGQSLLDAMKKSMSKAQLKEMKIVSTP